MLFHLKFSSAQVEALQAQIMSATAAQKMLCEHINAQLAAQQNQEPSPAESRMQGRTPQSTEERSTPTETEGPLNGQGC